MSETIGLMEPMILSESNSELDDLVFDLVQKSGLLARQLNPDVQKSIGHLVRSMNCYYSNLIEGHDTHPWDIERALSEDYSDEREKRNLQEEAVAHIAVQKMIDDGLDPEAYPATSEYTLWLHEEFCSRLPEDLLWAENPETGDKIKVIPGEIRNDPVIVGRHIPPLPENLDRFMARFEQAYKPTALSKPRRIIAAACAHHRFLWIHPFIDGNGRVSRLMSYSILMREGVGSSLWSVARGLAKNVSQYKKLLMAADSERQGDRDGRGTLSEKALTEFSKFFLEVCIDQVEYMESILRPEELLRRIKLYAEDEQAAGRLPKGSYSMLREVLLFGEVERGRAPEITGYKERMARTVVSELLKKGLLVSDTAKGHLRIGFPVEVIERWFPALYPDTIQR